MTGQMRTDFLEAFGDEMKIPFCAVSRKAALTFGASTVCKKNEEMRSKPTNAAIIAWRTLRAVHLPPLFGIVMLH